MQQGVLYIAFGERYRREALSSIASLRRFHPEMPVCVITESDFPDLPSGIDMLVREPETRNPLRAKPRYLGDSPFDRTLFLDTDTTVVRPIEPIFQLLGRFDIGLYILPGYTPDADYGYLSYPNSGVMLFRRCEAVSATFKSWLMLCDQDAERHASSSRGARKDDPVLMRAICNTEVRLVPLPAAMNFVVNLPTVTVSPIHIVHGRHPTPVGLASLVDQGRPPGWNPRVWVPQLQSPLPEGSLRRPAIWLRAPFYALHAVISRLGALLAGR